MNSLLTLLPSALLCANSEVVGIRWLSPANQARVVGDSLDVIPAAKPPRLGQGQACFYRSALSVQNRQQPCRSDGATATYAGCSGRSALTFSCTAAAARQNTAGLSATGGQPQRIPLLSTALRGRGRFTEEQIRTGAGNRFY